MNCQSIRNKRSAFTSSTDYLKPDIILGCESWLSNEHSNSEIFPEGYQTNVFRRDRNRNGGGVFIAVHDSLDANEVNVKVSDSELVWAEVRTKDKTITVGSFYRPPNAPIDSLKNLNDSIAENTEKKNKHIIIGGDFNLQHIDWRVNKVKQSANLSAHHQ
jgi:exonuclease III